MYGGEMDWAVTSAPGKSPGQFGESDELFVSDINRHNKSSQLLTPVCVELRGL
jgi:hypothetical protein